MAMSLLIQIAFLSLVMAQQPFGGNQVNYPSGWWYHIPQPSNPFLPPSTTCLLRSQLLVTRDDYTYAVGTGFYKVHTQAATWNDARKICEEEGGHLAIINSVAEAKAVTDIFEKAGSISGATGNPDWAHIGFHDLYHEGEYITIHGQSLARAGFSNWANGQPDNAGAAENCGSFHKHGGLNDVRCLAKYAFICEIPIY